jgi:UDP-3-O-[3-hydroxymyristoyl] glucosamine N-acyltransferase
MNNKQYTLAKLAEFLHAELRGDPACLITGIGSLNKANEQQISFLERANFRKYLKTTQAAAVIMSAVDLEHYNGNALLVANPQVSYAKLTGLFADIPNPPPGIHPSAVIGHACIITDSVRIAANCVIGDEVVIGENTIVEAGCVIGNKTTLGENCRLYPNVTLYYDVHLANRVVIHSGTVIGADGFGNANDKGVWHKIYQLGKVKIGDDVEIGANTCVDRGALGDTIIDQGAKLDNLIQIAHNVKIGAHTAMAGCTVVAGSVTIGKHCLIGGASTINGHITIADQTVITGDSTVGMSITAPGVYSSGLTVKPHRTWLRILAQLLKLDELVNRVVKLEEKEKL